MWISGEVCVDLAECASPGPGSRRRCGRRCRPRASSSSTTSAIPTRASESALSASSVVSAARPAGSTPHTSATAARTVFSQCGAPSAQSDGDDLAVVVGATDGAGGVRQLGLAAARAGDEGRRAGLPLRATRARVAARHPALGDGHGYFSSGVMLTRRAGPDRVVLIKSARAAHRGSTSSCCVLGLGVVQTGPAGRRTAPRNRGRTAGSAAARARPRPVRPAPDRAGRRQTGSASSSSGSGCVGEQLLDRSDELELDRIQAAAALGRHRHLDVAVTSTPSITDSKPRIDHDRRTGRDLDQLEPPAARAPTPRCAARAWNPAAARAHACHRRTGSAATCTRA